MSSALPFRRICDAPQRQQYTSLAAGRLVVRFCSDIVGGYRASVALTVFTRDWKFFTPDSTLMPRT